MNEALSFLTLGFALAIIAQRQSLPHTPLNYAGLLGTNKPGAFITYAQVPCIYQSIATNTGLL